MHRRNLLTAAIGGCASLGGCLRLPGSARTPPSSDVAEYEFALEWSRDWGRLDDGIVHDADVVVRSETEPPWLLVGGKLRSGSRSCMETVLHDLAFQGGTLTVEVSDDRVGGSDTFCTSELAAVPYEVSVTFADELPTAVVVTHLADRHEVEFHETMQVG